MREPAKQNKDLHDTGSKNQEKPPAEPLPDQYGDRGSFDEYQEK